MGRLGLGTLMPGLFNPLRLRVRALLMLLGSFNLSIYDSQMNNSDIRLSTIACLILGCTMFQLLRRATHFTRCDDDVTRTAIKPSADHLR